MIHIVCGLPGGGKSYLLTEKAYKAMQKGRRVLSNYPIKGAYKCGVDELVTAQFEYGDLVIIDEAGAFFNSSDWAKLPVEVFILFSQSRHIGIDLWVAVQQPMRLAKPLRELGNFFWWCEQRLFGRVFKRSIYIDVDLIGSKKDDDIYSKEWAFKRKAVYSLYDSWDLSLVGDRAGVEWEPWVSDIDATIN